MDVTKLLEQLTATPGPSGDEGAVASFVAELWRPYVNRLHVDRIGSLVAVKEGAGAEPRQRLLLAAHFDEIGLMVSQVIEHNGWGFLRVTSVGGVDRRHLFGQTVVVHGQRELTGVLGALPDSMLPEDKRNKPHDWETLVVDVGLPAQTVRETVEIGDFITFRQPLRQLQHKLVSGKAFDNRASVAAVTVCLEYLQRRKHDWDVVAVATAQEETRLLGAYTSAYAEHPDAAVAIDVTFGKGAMLTESTAFDLGSGPVLDRGPNVHPGMFEALKKAAESLEMEVSTSFHTRGSGTDAFGLQVARDGVPTGLVSIPLRYMHTMVETVNTDDIERAGRLLGEFTARLDGTFIDDLKAQMLEK